VNTARTENNVVHTLVKNLQQKSEGKFPQGKLNKEDKGELAIVIGKEDGCVKVTFPKPVDWIALTPDDTVELAFIMIRNAKELGLSKPFTLKL